MEDDYLMTIKIVFWNVLVELNIPKEGKKTTKNPN